jgi:hypothetical protein
MKRRYIVRKFETEWAISDKSTGLIYSTHQSRNVARIEAARLNALWRDEQIPQSQGAAA